MGYTAGAAIAALVTAWQGMDACHIIVHGILSWMYVGYTLATGLGLC